MAPHTAQDGDIITCRIIFRRNGGGASASSDLGSVDAARAGESDGGVPSSYEGRKADRDFAGPGAEGWWFFLGDPLNNTIYSYVRARVDPRSNGEHMVVLPLFRAGRPKLPIGKHQMVLHCACERWAGADSRQAFKLTVEKQAEVPEVSATSPGEEEEEDDEYMSEDGDSDEEDEEDDEECILFWNG